jgi:hypothetical protein
VTKRAFEIVKTHNNNSLHTKAINSAIKYLLRKFESSIANAVELTSVWQDFSSRYPVDEGCIIWVYWSTESAITAEIMCELHPICDALSNPTVS